MWVNHVSSIQHMEGWSLYIDGASNSRGSGLGVVLTAPPRSNDGIGNPLRLLRFQQCG
jgi:hypothetical protein